MKISGNRKKRADGGIVAHRRNRDDYLHMMTPHKQKDQDHEHHFGSITQDMQIKSLPQRALHIPSARSEKKKNDPPALAAFCPAPVLVNHE